MKEHLRSIEIFVLLFSYLNVFSQQGTISGKVVNELNGEPVAFASVVIQGSARGTVTDENGLFELTDLLPGLYNLVLSCIGFETKVIPEIQVSNSRKAIVQVLLRESVRQLQEVEIKANPFQRTEESPISVKSIGVNEIQRYPGGNRDISRVIQSLPGVASTVAFRNDIIIRGGAPNENRFYIDDIETPVINHFSTQGASGGPVGIFNVDMIKEAEFYSGAFPANRGNMLSSLLALQFTEGRNDRWAGRFTVGASEIALSTEGPTSKRSSLIISVRRSYLQLLFQALGLPFLPTYNDFTLKHVLKLNNRSDLTLLGIGAYDQFQLNLKRNKTEEQRYILEFLPVNTQWYYTAGVRYRLFVKNGTIVLVASRNQFNNRIYKYQNNDESNPEGKLSDYESEETENKLRAEHTFRNAGFKVNYGFNYEYALYTNNTYLKITTPVGIDTVNYQSRLPLHKYGLFVQASRTLFNGRWTLSLGLRTDGTNFSPPTSNLFRQLSPRLSSSLSLIESVKWNFNAGLYYQLPPYTTLGFRNNDGTLINKENGITYLSCTHVVSGFQFDTRTNAQISLEGFYKRYDRYPFLLRDSISLANLGGNFGVVGAEPAAPTSWGHAYGTELFFQQKLYKGFFGIIAITYVRSLFSDNKNRLVPSAWDNQYLTSLTFGKKFKRHWEIGWRWRLIGGTPYTPYNVELSSLKRNWDISRSGILDYNRLNTLRTSAAHQLDLRIDKKYFFKKWNLNIYLDIQNAYNFRFYGPAIMVLARDDLGNPLIENPQDPEEQQRYITKLIENPIGNIIPTVGIVIEL